MELLKNIIVDFCLFSLIEGYILTQFYEKICNCRKFKWYEIFILSFVNCIISQVFLPVTYQILIILWISFYLYILNHNYKYIKYLFFSLMSMIFILIIEMNMCLLYELIFKINFTQLQNIYLFMINIPLKFIELILINIFNKVGVKIEALGRRNR